LDGLGKLIDASREGLGDQALPLLSAVMEKRQEAVAAYSKRDFGTAVTLTDEAAKLLEGVQPERSAELGNLWQLERDLGAGKANYESANWTRPMLSLVGMVKASWLFKYQRHAFVVCLIVAAIITPTGDAVNLSLMAGPMLACYELGVLLVWLIEKRRKSSPAPEGADGGDGGDGGGSPG